MWDMTTATSAGEPDARGGCVACRFHYKSFLAFTSPPGGHIAGPVARPPSSAYSTHTGDTSTPAARPSAKYVLRVPRMALGSLFRLFRVTHWRCIGFDLLDVFAQCIEVLPELVRACADAQEP